MKRKRALITGGSRGIGKAISIMFAKNGYDVIVNYRSNEEAALDTKKEIESHNVSCTLMHCDISDFDKIRNLIEKEIDTNGSIDALIFNAAIRKDNLFPLFSDDEWNSVIDVNLKSFYYIAKPIIKGMFLNKWGRIILLSSTSGQTGMAGQVNYSATKAGIIGVGRSLAQELGRKNISVNIIAPGFIETEMVKDLEDRFKEIVKTIPMRRIGKPEDISNLVEFLISEKAAYITGQVIAVNGGVFT